MKILYVVSSAKFFLSHRLTLAKAAQSAGFDVHVATPISPLNSLITAAGFKHHLILLDRGGINPFKDVIAIFSLWRLYRALKPDLVHHVTIKPILYGGLVARWTKVPAVVHAFTGLGFLFISKKPWVRGARYVIYSTLKLVFRHKNFCSIFQNVHDRNLFLNKKLIHSEQCAVLHGSGVSMTTFIPSEESEKTPLVILASRLLWDKGIASSGFKIHS